MIQIDMKMPEYCDDCPMLDEHGDYPMCRITQETRGYTFDARKKRMDKCPMKPVEAVPLDKLCDLLAEMYHCPSSGWPSSGHACHPSCPDEAFEKLCGIDCENYSDAERWKAFLTKWMEGLDAK